MVHTLGLRLSSIDLNYSSSTSHYKWITALLEFFPMSNNASSTGTTTTFTTSTDLSGSHSPWMFPVLTYFEGPTINLTCGIFNTGTGLSESMFYFVNRSTVWWSTPSFTIDGRASKETSVDTVYTSLFLHAYVDFLYCDSMSHSHIILAGRCHITNRYCSSSARHLCTTWGTLASD